MSYGGDDKGISRELSRNNDGYVYITNCNLECFAMEPVYCSKEGIFPITGNSSLLRLHLSLRIQ